MSDAKEAVSFSGVGVVKKWTRDDFDRKTRIERYLISHGMNRIEAAMMAELRVAAQETVTSHNSLTSLGAHLLLSSLTGINIVPFDDENSYIGVGDNADQNPTPNTLDDLKGKVTRLKMDEGYPTIGDGENMATWRATADAEDANHMWNEWGIFNGDSGGDLLNRAVQNFGSKAPGTVWQIAVSISLS